MSGKNIKIVFDSNGIRKVPPPLFFNFICVRVSVCVCACECAVSCGIFDSDFDAVLLLVYTFEFISSPCPWNFFYL